MRAAPGRPETKPTKMKKMIAAIFAVLLAACLCGCNDADYVTLRHSEREPRETVDTDGARVDYSVTRTRTVTIPDVVYITDSGEKYHRAGCQYLVQSAREISLSDAEKLGYEPCSQCFG